MTHVIVVDDSALARRQASQPLADAGFATTEVAEEDRAPQTIRQTDPDAVVVDAAIPGGGFRDVREALDGSIPLVVATARDDEGHAERFLERGATDVVAKDPLYGVRIVNAVRRGLALTRQPRSEILPQTPVQVLVVDDSPVIRGTVERILAEAEVPLAVEEVPDAEQALDAVREEAVDVLLVDHVLPGMNGLELLTVLRREGIEAPAMALTGQRDPELAERFLAAGAEGIWTKEHEGPRRLRRTVEQLARRAAGHPTPR
jgi:CheY-like chemotaxis protein